jgi:hypothetical protein
MKNLKVVFASLMLAFGLIAFSSFKASTVSNKALSSTVYYHADVSEWSPASNGEDCAGGDEFCKVEFDSSLSFTDDIEAGLPDPSQIANGFTYQVNGKDVTVWKFTPEQ